MLPARLDRDFDRRALAERLAPAVFEAGRIVLAHGAAGVAVERKGDMSPVTAADREAEEVLLAALARIAPGVPVVAEEAVSAGDDPDAGGCFFLVDPLDGTRDFVSGSDTYTVNVGLVMDGRPVFGMVTVPALDEIYVTLGQGEAAMGRISDCQRDGAISLAKLAPIRTRAPAADGLVALRSPWRPMAGLEDMLADVHVKEWKLGGSSWKLCRVACGGADVYPQGGATHEWDTAAGQAVLEAAGGAVLVAGGASLGYGKRLSGYLNPPFVAWGRRPAGPSV